MKRWIVVLRLASQSVPEKIEFARLVVSSMKANKLFSDPIPGYDDITRLTDELQQAYEKSRDAGREQTALMHTKAFELDSQLTALGFYVQRIANENVENGDAIIYSAAMDVKRTGRTPERTFAVRNTPHAGVVVVVDRSEGRASYIWQYSLDQETWTTAKVTLKAKAMIEGLTPGKRYYFRVAAVLKDEQGPWKGPINIIVT